ncbi:Uncharacterized conserved protein [Plasmopara halstedii]|uniref:Uncharacterized conserved protein n=1 Tax=Plasmopara halstedii TaxID=4781 RepID=A0A0P1B7K9_PLAHL|nr:Uncharacterized conserved protein [Plasmopara halstedii]CEG50106.1 Uncharacterized conserved protein [Plasmopara halstedii]|eukprot:XP_024586475.1 Uncharacterized conserved protein [Plasmopara halstedii]
MLEVAVYATLCSRLSKFVQHLSCDEELREITDGLIKFYDHTDIPETHDFDSKRVGLAAIDELVLLTLHKLLNSYVRNASSILQEKVFTAFSRAMRRCKPRMGIGQEHRQLSFVQSCVLYLPAPPEAGGEQLLESTTLATQSEELRLAILKSLRELFQEENQQKQLIQHQGELQHFFAYLVASLLHIAQQDRCWKASLEAIEVLKLVLLSIRDPQTLRQYLPGVIANLWKSANAPQQSSKVIVAALNCFAMMLDLCIGDEKILLFGDVKQEQQKFTLEAIRQSVKVKGNLIGTNALTESPSSEIDEWLQKAAINVDIILSRMFSASVTAVNGTSFGSPRLSWRVRCALAQLCGTIVLQCRQALQISFFRCYDELLILRGDNIAVVANEANSVLQRLQASVLSPIERLKVIPEMADRFQMLLSTLVLKLGAEHEATKLHYVHTVRGYLAFWGPGLTPYLDSSMESIYSSLCHVVTFASLDVNVVVHQKLSNLPEDDKSSDAIATGSLVSEFQKRLRFFSEQSSVNEVLMMLRDVGAISTPAGFIDCAFTMLSDSRNSGHVELGEAEVVLVLNEFLRGYCFNNSNSNEALDVHLIGRILEDLLALDVWEEQKSLCIHGSIKKRVSQRALVVECVGVCAEILGAEFKKFLLHVLYPLVAQLGSHDVEVEHAALAALEKIYFYTGYKSLAALFHANMDYFVDSLCARLEQLDVYPMTAFVVEALLRHTHLASLPLVDEVASSLLRSVDLYQDSSFVNGLLRALRSLLSGIVHDAEKAKLNKQIAIGDAEATTLTSYSLLDSFIHEMKALITGGTDNPNIDADMDDEIQEFAQNQLEPQSVKGALPVEYDEMEEKDQGGYYLVVLEIVDRCGYFLVESDPIACCLVLSLINEGVRFLSQHPKQFLPLVARMWPELLPRLRVDNRAIVTGTINVISTVAETAGDFVGERFVETLWPVLQSQMQSITFGIDAQSSQLTRSMLLLKKVASIFDARSHEASSANGLLRENEFSAVSGTRKTQETRQLLAILSCLTTICRQSETLAQLVPAITRTCSNFLNKEAPREVVEKTSELFEALVQLNGDEVFCTVAPLANWVPTAPPCERFSEFVPEAILRFYQGHLSSMDVQPEFCRNNASILMNRLFS